MIFLGDKSAFDEDLQEKMIKLEEDTKYCNRNESYDCANYGGRDDIAHSARILAQKVCKR